MNALFPSTCVVCHGDISPGEEIEFHPTIVGPKGGKKVMHSGCTDGDVSAEGNPRLRAAPARRGTRSHRSRRNSGTFKVFHADHGIHPEQMDFIQSELLSEAPQGFFIRKVTLPAQLGTVPNALYGPDSGDAPVPESAVHYMDRSGRGWEDRMIDLPHRPVNYVQTIGIRDGDAFTLFTVYGGPLAPQNPADPGNRDPEGSRRWWSQHALSSQQWAGKNPRSRRSRR